jgi:hypothetical protein
MVQVATKHAAARQGVKSAHSAHGLHWLMSFGTLGLFVVSVIDSSIIPLPVPGSTDLLLILLVVHHANPVLAAVAATVGSICIAICPGDYRDGYPLGWRRAARSPSPPRLCFRLHFR